MRCSTLATAMTVVTLLACSEAPLDFEPQFARNAVTDPTASWHLPLEAAGLAFSSDGLFGANGFSVYANGTCGVTSKIFATTAASNSGDAVTQTDNPRYADRKCASYPRKVRFTYPDGASETVTFVGNLAQIQNTTYSIPIGTSALRSLNLSSSSTASRCGTLKFRPVDKDGNVLGADQVVVTRVDARTWDVATQAAPNDRAYCTNTGQLYSFPLRFRVVSNTPLP